MVILGSQIVDGAKESVSEFGIQEECNSNAAHAHLVSGLQENRW